MERLVLLSQCFLFVIACFLSFFIFPPVAKNQHSFDGNCLLFSRGKWDNNESETQLDVIWGDVGSCNFAVFVGVVTFLVSLTYIVSTSIHVYKGTEQSWLSSFLTLIVTSVFSALLMVTGIVVTTGFEQWCDLIDVQYHSCEVGAYGTFKIKNEPTIQKSEYFIQYGIAKFGIWTSFIAWVFLTALSSYKIYKYHTNENISISMNRERQRLIQHINPQQV